MLAVLFLLVQKQMYAETTPINSTNEMKSEVLGS